ncbi:AAA family ATPase [Actinoplanes sp. NEAU-A12]|uniref:histidine kinase n=1 Tax=Actinoplanes sandaracinus TaxID=3045177 RepID=A0ABT6WNX3_9ACTN|nr:AAA family ATPase [Actinoplanes sandaracinus]MDI6101399.1 AAA family ATPase [Actinoplanes sandaracinus]
MGDEVLYRSDHTEVVRQTGRDDHASVIGKRTTGAGTVRRIEHERDVLRHLAGLRGVPRLAARQSRQVLVLEDDGARPAPAGPLPVPRLIEVARTVTDTVAAMHRAGVLHRDITPANLIWPDAGPPILIDYDLAVIGPARHRGGEQPKDPVGTLGYLAPEQTGRIRLAVDERSDLYGLGATLYALATGSPPFAGDDPLELIRATLVETPVFPTDRNPQLPPRLAEILMRLLEKDPDRRYQSADGLAHDLARLAAGSADQWTLGERDFPAFLAAPARLVGRDQEIRRLTAALEQAPAGGPALLVTGPPGIGKSALIQALRPMITARDGWFVAGKYDQFRTGTHTGGIVRAVRGLTRLLLAEPEPGMTADRERMAAALGPNAAMVAAAVPEMAAFLGPGMAAGPIDATAGHARLSAATVAMLRAVAAHHPTVFVLDDLQWASSASLRVVDSIVSAGPMPGLLLVGIYRDEEVDATHPLSALAAHWERDGGAGPPVHLGGLTGDGLADLIGAILRMPPEAVTELADLISEGSGGNPYETVELLNALRTEGLLTLAENGWQWDRGAVHAFVARHRVPQLLAARLEQQPEESRRLMTALACLGGDVRPALLAAATALPEPDLVYRLAPAVAEGLVAVDPAVTAIRFRHDLIHRAAHQDMAAAEREQLQLAMARRLADRQESRQEAAEQYLAVTGLVTTPEERRIAADLLHTAGRRTVQMANYPVAEELLAAAQALLAAAASGPDAATRDAVAVDRHSALYCSGRLDEADQVYRDLVDGSPELLTLATATAIQINSLTQRGLNRPAVDLGLDVLHRFGVELPRDLTTEIAGAVTELYTWAERLPSVPTETTDPGIIATARLVHRLLPPAFQLDPLLHAWVVIQGWRLWARHGVCPPLVGTMGSAVCVTIDQRDDYRTGYLLARHVVAVGRECGYQADTAVAQFMYLCLAAHWFEPLEEIAETVQQVHEDLLAAGDVQVASLLSTRLLALLLESADSLEVCADEIPSALSFAERTGSRYSGLAMIGYRQLLRALRGQTSGPGRFAAPDFDEDAYLGEISRSEPVLATYHTVRGLAALIFDDAETLDAHSAAAMAHVRGARGYYVTAHARLLRCLSLTGRIRADGRAAAEVLAELAGARDWLARRAADAPRNFGPLLHLVDAERAWALGDPAAAARDFDAGLQEVVGRPWHQALLAERAGLFHLSQGLTYTAHSLLAEARDTYLRWGATGKVSRIEASHPFLRATTSAGTCAGTEACAGRVDLLAILRASQALSRQTTVSGLQAAVGEVLSAMTGATDVRLAFRHRDDEHWYVSAITGGESRHTGVTAPVTDPEAGPADVDPDRPDEDRLPMSALRYALRTREPLLVADAIHDDRFSRDPYLAGLEACSLLVVPIPSGSAADSVLVLENHRQSGVFSTERLETVRHIAGQLAVSLDNALLYDSMESTVRARTADLAATNRELSAANRLKADLIGMLGHEINNPLAMILGYVDLALTDEMPDPIRDLVMKIHRNAQRLNTIVHEVLALVSIDAGRLNATPRPVSVADHIQAALAATATTGVAVSCPPDLIAAVQPGHLDQILTNLVSNATKYGGGATAIIARADTVVETSAGAETDGGPPEAGADRPDDGVGGITPVVTVEVRDEGTGVPPEFRDRLFDRFARAEPTAGTVAGTGLGLYIVRELARANGGDVQYRSAPLRGSIFVLTLPAPSATPAPAHREPASAQR